MRPLITIAGMLVAFSCGLASAHESPSAEDAGKIAEALASTGCSSETEDVMTHEGGFEVMLVTCEDGSYFMELNGAFEIVKKIKQ